MLSIYRSGTVNICGAMVYWYVMNNTFTMNVCASLRIVCPMPVDVVYIRRSLQTMAFHYS